MAGSPVGPSTRVVRLVLSLLVAALAGAVVLATRDDELTPPVDVVGFPSHQDFSFAAMFTAYRLAVFIVPLVTVVSYAVLARWGPWAGTPVGPASDERALRLWPAVPSRAAAVGLCLPVVLVSVLAVSSSRSGRDRVSVVDLVVGVVVLVVLVIQPSVWARVAAAAVAPVLAVTWFARHTSVEGDGFSRTYAWIPWWLAAAALVVVALSVTRSTRLGTSPETLLRRLVAAWVLPALVGLGTAAMPLVPARFEGFDDAQSVTGAALMQHGLLPWRDVMLIHGPFEDGLRSLVGWALFEHTLWGSNLASTAVWGPLFWIGLYTAGALLVRGSLPACAGLAVALLGLGHVLVPSYRWVAMGFVVSLLVLALRSPARRWTALLTGALFVQAVLVPESALVVVAVLATLLLAALRGPAEPGVGRWRRLVTFLVSGAVLTAGLVLLLWRYDALDGFVTYFLVFGPGHAATGAIPFFAATVPYRLTFLFVVVVLTASLVRLGTRTVDRRSLSVVELVLVCCALCGALYGEKAIARFDDPHVLQVLSVVGPLVVGLLAVALARPRVTPVAIGGVVLVLLAPWALAALVEAPGANKVVDPEATWVERIGVQDGAVDEELVADLGGALDALTEPGERVFDFSNSPGYVNYLLGLEPATTYYQVSMAVAEHAQEQLVDQLDEARPSVVVLDASSIGLNDWDGVPNPVRHYLVAEHVLDGWSPAATVDGVLLLLRDDLAGRASAVQTLPGVTAPAPLRSCDWGSSPVFLPREETSDPVLESLDAVDGLQVTVRGMAEDPEGLAVTDILLAQDGEVVDSWPTTIVWPPAREPGTGTSVEPGGFDRTTLVARRGGLAVFAQLADGSVHPLDGETGTRPTLEDLDGSRLTVEESTAGSVSDLTVRRTTLARVAVPAGGLTAYDALELRSDAALGTADVVLLGERAAPTRDWISVRSLPVAGDRLQVRVGSCLQWHEWSGSYVYLWSPDGAVPLTDVEFARSASSSARPEGEPIS